MISIHSELFLMNKSLIVEVFKYGVKEIYSRLLKLFSKIPQFCEAAIIQSYADIFCLRETFKKLMTDESNALIEHIIKLIPKTEIIISQNQALITKIINDFQKGMLPYINVLHSSVFNQSNNKTEIEKDKITRVQF
jgi:hypothetical protein